MANPLAYWSSSFDTIRDAKVIIQDRDPTPYDNSYRLSQQWLNRSTRIYWVLTGRNNKLAIWEQTDNLALDLEDGQVQIGRTGDTPISANLTAGANISIVNGAGSITINGADPVAPQQFAVINSSQSLQPNYAYFVDALTPVSLALPTVCEAGKVIEVAGQGALFVITQSAGQQIRFHSMTTTLGVLGQLQSTSPFDCVTLRCVVENNFFIVHPSTGNFNII